jgi:hypothetical protein
LNSVARKSCPGCGLALPEGGGSYRCFVSKKVYSAEELAQPWDCPFFCAPRPEDGEQLSPEQLYLLKKDEFERKK